MKRLVDDPAFSELRAEFERSRSAGHDYAALAKLPQLREALDRAPSPGEDTLLEHGSLGAQVFSATSPWMIAVVVAAVGAAVYVAWPAAQQPEPAPASQPKAASVPRPAPPPEPPPPAAIPEPPPSEVAAPPVRSSPAPAARSSRREIAQLVRIRALLERDPVAAYRLAERSELEFPGGLLSEERQALQILALARSGDRDAAKQRARAFFERFPQSPMRERVEAALRR